MGEGSLIKADHLVNDVIKTNHLVNAVIKTNHMVSEVIKSNEFVNDSAHLLSDLELGDPPEDRMLSRWPSFTECAGEAVKLVKIGCPLVLTGLLLYTRSAISMLFLGHLGDLELSGGSLAIGFANITGYSILTGLAMGMEPICGQAYGAKQWKLLGLTMQRMVTVLLFTSIPISLLWLNMGIILRWCGQDPEVTAMAYYYLLFSVPDLVAQSFLHPLRIFLRSQNITIPLSCCAALALILHVPVNLLLVEYLGMGVKGVALAAAWTNLHMVTFLVIYLTASGRLGLYWDGFSYHYMDCFKEWKPLLGLAIPSCLSVCLEWWCYELMIILAGLLPNPRATVATMGILIQLTALVYIFPSSLATAVSVRVSNELGANRPAHARFTALVGLVCSALMGVLAMGFTSGLRDRWGSVFTHDPDILQLTAIAMLVLGLCELGNSAQTVGCGVLRGSAQLSTAANINLLSFYVVGMPVAVVLVFILRVGFAGLWLGMLAAQASCVTSMLFAMFQTDWLLQAQRSKEITGSSSKPTYKTPPPPTTTTTTTTTTIPLHLHELDLTCIKPHQTPLYMLTTSHDDYDYHHHDHEQS